MSTKISFTSAAELILAFAILVLSFGRAEAQPQPRDFGVFADEAGTVSWLQMQGFQAKTVYVVGFELDGEVKGFEFAIHLPVNAVYLSVDTRQDSGLAREVPPWIARGLGGCFPGEPTFRFATVNFGFFHSIELPPDQLACLGAYDPPSPSLGGRPGYVQCDSDVIPLGYAQNGGSQYPDGCLIINPTHPYELPVATEERSFGTLKARYSRP